RDRTADLVLTKDVLCQLSYVGPSITPASSAHLPRLRHPAQTDYAKQKKSADNPLRFFPVTEKRAGELPTPFKLMSAACLQQRQPQHAAPDTVAISIPTSTTF
ncbi:MAG: hypothetical protein NTY53_02165, partial [Kiritimatiellaeota bacterium]|nr:hypothetical protein [Kiritimatiellota bacterium]